ncbi:MAG TPA: FAD-dependent oxidoreductase [Alphaproteobacteria bacterium]|nr:FAD-dependent oxidoreductase [Alphaproteobacteria bacterium]USO05685.1 MAG: FAD-dependent oxidoreductase [Rhodospirillales bacterium]HOO82602.1 FAD-dependent oxidoreductase [Alphaproteobacteria bacterium]
MSQQPQNIAIIGAGITGLCSAYTMLEDGHGVTLYDPAGFPADNASFMAGGMLAPLAEIEHMPHEWIEAGLGSIALWAKFAEKHGDGLGFDFRQNGSLLLAHEEDRYILQRFAAHLPAGKGEYTATSELEPALAEKFPQGLYLAEEAHINPAPAMHALCDYLKAAGVTFIQEKADPTAISAQYDHVLDCRGMGAAWEDKNLRGVKGEIVIVHNTELALNRPVRLMHPCYPLYIVPRPDHIFMIGATIIESSDNTQVSIRSGLELLSALYSLHPSFSEAEIIEVKAGIRPSYPDNLPRIEISKNDNIIRCNGLFRHGFMLSPIIGRCVADHIAGGQNNFLNLLKKDRDEHHHQRAA